MSAVPEQASSTTQPPRRGGPGRLALLIGLPLVVVAALLAVIVVMASAKPTPPSASDRTQFSQAAHNPDVDPGTSLPGTTAPPITLTNQFGARVSLSQFSGKVVILAFVDARCTTVCPLTTVSMTEAVRMLGPSAAGHVQLLGIDANPDATAVSDVHAYSVAHQMTHSWDFLTGTRGQLAAVWRAYHVFVAASHGNIDHEPALYLIDEHGKERTLYLTQMAYAGVGQQAELIAAGLSGLLPGHPAPHDVIPLTLAKPIGPAKPTTLPVIGGADSARSVELGPGHPHLLVFLASWVSEVSDLPAELRTLASYQRQALKHGWPTVVAVDESQTEPNLTDLPRLLDSAGGAKLGFPVVADTSGRVADGYGVTDIPWIEVTSSTGRILSEHDGWLSQAALAKAVARAAK